MNKERNQKCIKTDAPDTSITVNTDQVTLYWSSVAKATNYWVQVQRPERKEWETIVVTIQNFWPLRTNLESEELSVRVASNSNCGPNYSVPMVVTLKGQAVEVKKPEVEVTKPVVETPEVCTQLKKPMPTIKRLTDSIIGLGWPKVTDAEDYQIEITQPGKGWEQVAVTEFLVYKIERQLENGVKYQVRVAAQNQCDMEFSKVMEVPVDLSWK